VGADPLVFAPNAFTPNEDGRNDSFYPVLNGFVGWNYKLLIFDRWGEVIYETKERLEGWDGRSNGREAQIDVYVWKVIVERDGDARDFVGHVSLIR
jgi:gliding motility-associated-like protein